MKEYVMKDLVKYIDGYLSSIINEQIEYSNYLCRKMNEMSKVMELELDKVIIQIPDSSIEVGDLVKYKIVDSSDWSQPTPEFPAYYTVEYINYETMIARCTHYYLNNEDQIKIENLIKCERTNKIT